MIAVFGPLYDWTLRWAAHRHAPWYLGGLSFAESSFFPIPPDVMLAPMAMARPNRALWYALITTLCSVLGGVLGYAIGYFALELVEPLLRDLGYWTEYQEVRHWFDEWGFWVVLVAGFSPIPYKMFTLAAGALALNPLLFVAASVISRGARFFLVAWLIAWGGPRLEPYLRRYIERLGWATVVLLLVVIATWKL